MKMLPRLSSTFEKLALFYLSDYNNLNKPIQLTFDIVYYKNVSCLLSFLEERILSNSSSHFSYLA